MDAGGDVYVSEAIYVELRAHVLPGCRPVEVEQAAFLFVRANGDHLEFAVVAWEPLDARDFLSQSALYLELSDRARARVIKRAHDLGASLVEVHSHPLQAVAEFSPSDWAGFREFVPHVHWRLKERPYGAVVMTSSSYDALIWHTKDVEAPAALRLRVGGQILEPTGRTLARAWR